MSGSIIRTERQSNIGTLRGMYDRNGKKLTVEEMHASLAFPVDAKCVTCKAPPMVRVIVMYPWDEFLKAENLPPTTPKSAYANILVPIKRNNGDPKPETFIRVSLNFVCNACRPALEKALARAKSYAIVELTGAPEASNKTVISMASSIPKVPLMDAIKNVPSTK